MWVVFRMGPFIHGEWRNGGLPQWLLDRLGKRARSNDPEYLRLARTWYEKELEIAVPRLFSRGGADHHGAGGERAGLGRLQGR